jgi:hypothetical protein
VAEDCSEYGAEIERLTAKIEEEQEEGEGEQATGREERERRTF